VGGGRARGKRGGKKGGPIFFLGGGGGEQTAAALFGPELGGGKLGATPERGGELFVPGGFIGGEAGGGARPFISYGGFSGPGRFLILVTKNAPAFLFLFLGPRRGQPAFFPGGGPVIGLDFLARGPFSRGHVFFFVQKNGGPPPSQKNRFFGRGRFSGRRGEHRFVLLKREGK